MHQQREPAAKKDETQQPDTAQTEAEKQQSTAWAGRLAGSASPPPELPTYLDQAPPQARNQLILAAQKRHGNKFVQRMLARQSSSQVQRQTIGSKTGEKHTFNMPSVEIPTKGRVPWVPLTLSKITFTGQSEVTTTKPNTDPAADEDRRGFVVGPEGAGVQREVAHEWRSWTTEQGSKIKLTSKKSAELRTDGGEVSFELLGIASETREASLKFNLLNLNGKESKLEWPHLALEFVPTSTDPRTKTLADGTVVTFTFKPKIVLQLDVDATRVAQWLADAYAKEAAMQTFVTGGMITAGIATLVANFYQMTLGSEVAERIELAAQHTRDFCNSYALVMQGEMSSGYNMFAIKGAQTAMKVLSKADAPPEAMHKEAKKRNLQGEAFGYAWPYVKEKMLEAYREEHSVEWFFYGEKGPGYKLLKWTLEDPRWSPDQVYQDGP